MADQYLQGVGGVRTVTTLDGTEVLVAEILLPSAETVLVPLSVLVTELFGTYVIGGAGATGITTNNAAQTIINKLIQDSRIDDPQLNEAVDLTVTSTDLNKVPAHLAGTADKHASDKVTHTSAGGASVKTALDYLFAWIAALPTDYSGFTYGYHLEWTQSGTGDKDITAATIMTALGINSTNFVILPDVNVQLTEIGVGVRELTATGTWKINTATVNGQVVLDKLTCATLSNEVVYGLNVTLKIAAKAGGGA